MRKIALALALVAVAAMCIPALASAQKVDAAAVKAIWGSLSPAEQAEYRALLDKQNNRPRLGPGQRGPGGSDSCTTAEVINGCNTQFPWDNTAATTDGVPDPLCLAFGTDDITNDVWYCWENVNGGDTVTVETCNKTTADTKIAVYGPFADCTAATAACPGGPAVACNDDTCSLQSQVVFGTGAAGDAYLFRVGNFPGGTPGSGAITVNCAIPVELQEFTIE